MELNGAVLGIVGMGKIGQAVARRAFGFGMKILFTEFGYKKYTWCVSSLTPGIT